MRATVTTRRGGYSDPQGVALTHPHVCLTSKHVGSCRLAYFVGVSVAPSIWGVYAHGGRAPLVPLSCCQKGVPWLAIATYRRHGCIYDVGRCGSHGSRGCLTFSVTVKNNTSPRSLACITPLSAENAKLTALADFFVALLFWC